MKRYLFILSVLIIFGLTGMTPNLYGQRPRAAVGAASASGTVEIKGLHIENIGISERLFRMSDNGALMLDDAGMHMEVTVDLACNGLAGRRLICFLMPVDESGVGFRDSMGDLMSMYAFTPASQSDLCSIKIPVPYGWVIRDGEKVHTISFSTMVMDAGMGDDSMLAGEIVNIDPSQVNIDKDALPGHMIGQLFGGTGKKNSGGGMGDLLGGLFGGPSATSTRDCGSCDGDRICTYCDGDGFFDPSVCRKCVKDPGVCRRCGGAGTEEIEVELHDSLF